MILINSNVIHHQVVVNMKEILLQTLDRICGFFEIGISISSCNIFDWDRIPSRIKFGVYVIACDDLVVYVGKGTVRDRQKTHIQKITGSFRKAKDTVGFKMLREHTDIQAYDCEVYYFDCTTAANASAVEGALIKFLNPLANKETYGEHFQGLSGKDKLKFK